MDWNHLFLSFQGRIGRQSFWIGVILLTVLQIAINLVLGAALVDEGDTTMGPALSGLIGLLLIWPSLAVNVKRWHDRDKSGWWVLIVLIPIIGFFWWLIECGMLPGTPGPNRFGPDPLDADGALRPRAY